jgi:hypothetical protein
MKFVQILTTLLVLVLVPIYFIKNGFLHFLWISDIALFITLAAVWRKSTLLLSIAMIYAFPFEIIWNLDFIIEIITGNTLLGLAAYMFEEHRPLHLRLLSLFHIYMFVLWIWLTIKWGYDRRGFVYGTVLYIVTILFSFGLTEPEQNINWVFLIKKHDLEHFMPYWLWPIIMMVVAPIFLYLPAHLLLKRYAKEPK